MNDVELNYVNSVIDELKESRDRATRLLAVLADEAARLRSDLSRSPVECIEMLRKHAIACLNAGESVTFYHDSYRVKATACRDHTAAAGDQRCWKVFYSGSRDYESHTTQRWLLDSAAEARMFAANVEKP